jgi:23S rRNA (adenine-N6)-dimethyltransferase
VSAVRPRRTFRGERSRRLGQNFLGADLAEGIVAEAAFAAGDSVVEIGPGRGAFTRALARRRVRVVAVEIDPALVAELRARLRGFESGAVRVVAGDFLGFALPREPFRVLGSLPFGRTTDVLRRLLDDPRVPLVRADLVVQWEVARKRAAAPPASLLSAQWAPWWEFRLGRRIPAGAFQPVPAVDAGLLTIVRRRPPLLPVAMARSYARFLRARWPFGGD